LFFFIFIIIIINSIIGIIIIITTTTITITIIIIIIIIIIIVTIVVLLLLFIIYTINLPVVRPRSCRVIYYFDTPTLGRRHQSFGRVTYPLDEYSCLAWPVQLMFVKKFALPIFPNEPTAAQICAAIFFHGWHGCYCPNV